MGLRIGEFPITGALRLYELKVEKGDILDAPAERCVGDAPYRGDA